MKIKKLIYCSIVILLTLGFVTTSCSDDGVDPTEKEPLVQYDPSRPFVVDSFMPKEGAARTRLFIDGSNFGTDVSKIKIAVGGRDAVVIGSTGTRIYALVPKRADEGDVVVSIVGNKGDVVATKELDEKFNFISRTVVGTLVGKIDPATNTTSMIDGTFAEAEFEDAWWIEFDKNSEGEKNLYVVERNKALRQINLQEEWVKTVFTNGQGGFRQFQTMTFENSRDTMFFADDHGQSSPDQMPVLLYSLRKDQFRKVYPYIYDRTGYSVTQHPDGTIFYNTWFDAGVLKARGTYDETKKAWIGKKLFNVNADNKSAHTYMLMHPEGKYVYMVGAESVSRADYNKTTKELENPVAFVGSWGSGNYEDAPGTSARFREVRQGVFVKNESYVIDGKDDVYDFYLCDLGNHCIRKITPEGLVSTYAGRGSYQVGSDLSGWIDGDIRQEARFRNPSGICYDEEEAIFYIADRNNKRIRYIAIE